jgi:putative aldouronate transport system substrate-binding protein
MAIMTYTDMEDLPLVQEEVNKITKEKINAKVNIVAISPGAWQQQTNLMLTGNEKLDLIVSSSGFGYSTQAARGQYVALDDLLTTHGQGILDVVPEHILESTKINGKIYAVPSMRDYGGYYGFVMRKDIVDKHQIDLDQVKTIADLENVFKIVKEKESTLTPVVNTHVPVASALIADKYDGLEGSPGVVSYKNGNLVNMFEEQEYVDAIKLTRKWYEAGYLLKDSATSKERPQNIVKANQGFGFFSNIRPGFDQDQKRFAGHEMVSVKLTDTYSTTAFATVYNMSIAKNSQNPEKAMEFLNLLYTDKDIMNLLANGIEGKHYEVKPNGLIALPEGVTKSNYTFNQFQVGNNFLTYPWEGTDPDIWEQMKEFNKSALLSPAFGFVFNADPVKTEIAATSNVMNQYRKGLESGTLDPAKALPEFNEKLKAAGLDKIIAEKKKQYEKWKANQ